MTTILPLAASILSRLRKICCLYGRLWAQQKATIALATDGDGDRIGAMDADGRFINAHQIMALLTKYLMEKRGWTGGVAQTLTVSELVKRVAAKYGRKLMRRQLALNISPI